MKITMKLFYATIEYLWQIIDDIDTMSDIAKNDDIGYRKKVEQLQNKRWKTGITSDGYTLNFEKLKKGEKSGK